MFEQLNGRSVGWRTMDYTWRDAALYALAIGAGEEDLPYVYEENMKVLPSFGVLPVFSNIHVCPAQPSAYSAFFLARDLMAGELGRPVPNGLHMWHELIMRKPIPPVSGRLVYDQVIKGSYPWRGKGVITEVEVPVYDAAGQLLCVNRSTSATRIEGLTEDGTAAPDTKVLFPDRKCDEEMTAYISSTQHLLYRLTGDTTPVHADPKAAKELFGSKVFMHGLCTWGYACRMAIRLFIRKEPERMTRFAGQMRNIVYPGTEVLLKAWKTEEGRAVCRLLEKETGRVLIDHGVMEWN